jgi:hypothetical protein
MKMTKEKTLQGWERLQKIWSDQVRDRAKQITLDELNRFSADEPDALSKPLDKASPRGRINRVEKLLEKLLAMEESGSELLKRKHPHGCPDDKCLLTKAQWRRDCTRLSGEQEDAKKEAVEILKHYPSTWILDTTGISLRKMTSMDASSHERSEFEAVAFIMSHISEDGTSSQLWRFRRCQLCKRWLYADRKDRYYCPVQCRRRTPEATKKRNAQVKRSRKAFAKKWLILPAAKVLREGRSPKGKEVEFVTQKVNVFREIERAKNPAFTLQTSGGQHSLRRAPEPIFQKSVTRNWNAIVAASKSPDLDKQLAEMQYLSNKR